MGLDQDIDKYRTAVIEAIKKIGIHESARRVGCTAGYISQVANKVKVPGIRSLQRIATALKVEI